MATREQVRSGSRDRVRRTTVVGLVWFLALVVGCSRSPTSPTTPQDVRPVDPRFDDTFWRQLIFNGFEEPGRVEGGARSLVLRNASPNVYVKGGEEYVDLVRDAVPRHVEQITGQKYEGRIESGAEDRTAVGWIVVEFVTPESAPSQMRGLCGWAYYGADPGLVRIMDVPRCVGNFHTIFAHELGHAFGLHHVADPGAVMHRRDIRTARFTAREQYHARLAYEVGRDAGYCGWPFGVGCAVGSAMAASGPPVAAFD